MFFLELAFLYTYFQGILLYLLVPYFFINYDLKKYLHPQYTKNMKIYLLLNKITINIYEIYITCIHIHFKYNNTGSPVSYNIHKNNSHIHK